MKHEIHYQSTDLDLQAPLDLASLADALTNRGLCLYHAGPWQDGSWSARFTVSFGFLEPDKDTAAILTAIESLDESSQLLWAACTSRDVNIGYQ